MITHSLGINYVSPSGSASASLTGSGNSSLELVETISASAVNQQVNPVSIPVSGLQCFVLLASANMVVYTNSPSTGSPAQTFTLYANQPFYWFSGNGSNPITTAITQLYVTSTPGGTLSVRALANI